MKTLEGKIAVVTGGSSGIGLATAKHLHGEGAKVAISGRDQAALTAAVTEIGPDIVAVPADISKSEDLDAFIEALEKTGSFRNVITPAEETNEQGLLVAVVRGVYVRTGGARG